MDLLCVYLVRPRTPLRLRTVVGSFQKGFVKENFHPSGLRNNRRKWNVMIVALNERTNETQIKEKVVVLKTRRRCWNEARPCCCSGKRPVFFFFSLIRWGSPPIELREENLLFICVCLFVASRIDSRLLVFRIRLPVTLSVKGEKKKAKASTWRNHTSLKRSSSLVLRRQKRPNFYFLSFSRRIRIDGWASNRLVEKRK